MKPFVVVMNFSHAYEEERYMRDKRFKWVDCTGLTGVTGYCSGQAERELAARISGFSPEGIHFIDSGNYHYLSKLWTDKIRYPFSLVVFDHHPDMQPPLFDGLLSCGCWVKAVLDRNPFCRKVYLVGASERLARAIDPAYRSRILFFGEHAVGKPGGWRRFAAQRIAEPIYISVDKDVLNREEAVTDWDQGSLTLQELEELLVILFRKQRVIGVDICGECSRSLEWFGRRQAAEKNGRGNRELVRLLKKVERERRKHLPK